MLEGRLQLWNPLQEEAYRVSLSYITRTHLTRFQTAYGPIVIPCGEPEPPADLEQAQEEDVDLNESPETPTFEWSSPLPASPEDAAWWEQPGGDVSEMEEELPPPCVMRRREPKEPVSDWNKQYRLWNWK